MDYNGAFQGNFVFVPEGKGLNKMSRFIPQKYTVEASKEKLKKIENDKNYEINEDDKQEVKKEKQDKKKEAMDKFNNTKHQ